MVVPPDDESIAALIDGTLDEQERERVLSLIASSPIAYEKFRDAAALAAAVADSASVEPRSAAVQTKKSPTRRLFWYAAPLAAAAALVIALVLPRVPSDDALVSALYAPAHPENEPIIGADWNVPPWSVARSAQPNFSRGGLAFRIGARLLQLETAAVLDDTVAMGVAVDEVSKLTRLIPGATALADGLLRECRDGSLWSVSTRRDRMQLLQDAVGLEPYFELGRAVEAARHAVRRSDTAYFAYESPARRHMQSVLEKMESENPSPPWQALLEELSGLFAQQPSQTGKPAVTRADGTDELFTRVPW